jgi:hypothetical protein
MTKYVKLRAEDWEFYKSLLYLCHGMMECMANSDLTPKEAYKMLDKLQATERLYFESGQKPRFVPS